MFTVSGIDWYPAQGTMVAYENGVRYVPTSEEIGAAHHAARRYYEAFGYACAMQDQRRARRDTATCERFAAYYAAGSYAQRMGLPGSTWLRPVADAYMDFMRGMHRTVIATFDTRARVSA